MEHLGSLHIQKGLHESPIQRELHKAPHRALYIHSGALWSPQGLHTYIHTYIHTFVFFLQIQGASWSLYKVGALWSPYGFRTTHILPCIHSGDFKKGFVHRGIFCFFFSCQIKAVLHEIPIKRGLCKALYRRGFIKPLSALHIQSIHTHGYTFQSFSLQIQEGTSWNPYTEGALQIFYIKGTWHKYTHTHFSLFYYKYRGWFIKPLHRGAFQSP